ncbi:MAG: SDR family oxidoreductase [Anaeromyxobacter sp.]|nr:SDR family oxidoreductase [Anaeromyxobacter sp.]
MSSPDETEQPSASPSDTPRPASPVAAPAPSPAEIEAAVRVLSALVAEPALLASVGDETRKALLRAGGELAGPDLKSRKRLLRAILRKKQEAKKQGDEALRRSAGIRKLREEPVFRPPFPVLPPRGTDASEWWPVLHGSVEAEQLERERVAAAGLRVAAGAEPDPSAAAEPGAAAGPELATPRSCYVCKLEYRRLHHFYDQLCPACGDENERRRTATVDLRGRVALVTGARVKIGFQGALLLLRAGCTVVACTRFPRDAAVRYAAEPDFEAWRDRLIVHGVDLRHTPSVEHLCHWLDQTLPRLDFQVHNACQTVRRPPGFYGHLLDDEHRPVSELPAGVRDLLRSDEAIKAEHAGRHSAAGLTRSAQLTQAASDADLLLAGAGPAHLEIFPKGVLDQDLQQVDLRTTNSWRLALDQVPTLELLEVLLVNATAPFVMTARLRPLMARSATPPPGSATSGDAARHVVLVSAMEGQFYRSLKTDRHPHTNMAKAALNMLVRTSAPDLRKDGIYLNAVDTGWVTDEDPAHIAARKAEENAFSPPLDIIDGAARIVAPIVEGFQTGRHQAGHFYKDYRPAPW